MYTTMGKSHFQMHFSWKITMDLTESEVSMKKFMMQLQKFTGSNSLELDEGSAMRYGENMV